MAFKKGNKLGANKFLEEELDDEPICFKGKKGQKEKLKAVPEWQERLREFVDKLITDQRNKQQ